MAILSWGRSLLPPVRPWLPEDRRQDRTGRGRLFEMQHPLVFLNNRKTYRESQSAAHRFGGEIRIENFRRYIHRNAAAVIRDSDLDVAAARQERTRFVVQFY